jgi:small-conductance mechanosensitive channel
MQDGMFNRSVDLVQATWSHMGPAAFTALRVLVIVIVAWVAVAVLQRAIRALRVRIAARLDDREAVKRAETLGRVFRYLAAVVVSDRRHAGAQRAGRVSVAPILGAAGVVGLAVGFGAQSLVRTTSPASSCCWRTRSARATWSSWATTPAWWRR